MTNEERSKIEKAKTYIEEILTSHGTPRRSGRYPWGFYKEQDTVLKDLLAMLDDVLSSE